MSTRINFNRRSFVARVTGSVATTSGAFAFLLDKANAQTATGLTDSDSGANADRPGYGRGGARNNNTNNQSGYTGLSDHDPSDQAGHGHGGSNGGGNSTQSPTGLTDHDSSDRSGYGRTGNAGGSSSGGSNSQSGYTGLSDHDPSDQAGHGRGGSSSGSSNTQSYTGLTDHDSSDRSGYGRTGNAGGGSSGGNQGGAGQTGLTDSDSGSNADRSGYGRGANRNSNGGNTQNYTGLTDRDPSDRSGYGRTGGGGSSSGSNNQGGTGQTGLTDSDSGSNADRSGYGRGANRNNNGGNTQNYTGLTDHDPSDRSGYGRSGTLPQAPEAPYANRTITPNGRTGLTDRDSGVNADRSGYGRGTNRNNNSNTQNPTGLTDRDPSDRSGYGRTGNAGGSSSGSNQGSTRGGNTVAPVPGGYPISGNVTQGFGVPWSENSAKTHTGVDIAAARGTSVPAVSSGIAHIRNLGADWGYAVVVEEAGGTARGYLHVVPSVREGDRVSPGTIVGTVWRDHLHYNVCRTVAFCQRGALPTNTPDPAYPNDPLFPGPFVRP